MTTTTRDPIAFLVPPRPYNGEKMLWMMQLARESIAHVGNKTNSTRRRWFTDLLYRFDFHPVVRKAVQTARPDDWHLVVLQHPHIPEDGDRSRVAYTQTEFKGERNVQTVTSLGKYLRAQFSSLSDHQIRDLVASAQPSQYKFVNTTHQMIDAIQSGPKSCMVWTPDEEEYGQEDFYSNHPYATYAPEYGWHMALRYEGSVICGRALCMTKGDYKFFVRSYKRSAGYSYADDALELWLREQGYRKRDSWEGCCLAWLTNPHANSDTAKFLAPYLDGDVQRVSEGKDDDGKKCLFVDSDGDYVCDNTDGSANEDSGAHCDDCGDRIDECDGYWVGRHEDRHVCEHCFSANYVRAYGCRRQEYFITYESAVSVGDNYYDEQYLNDNNIVQTVDGDYYHIDDTVYVDRHDEYYESSSDDYVYCKDSGEYERVEECQYINGKYYHNNECVEVDGQWYLIDEAPEPAESSESND